MKVTFRKSFFKDVKKHSDKKLKKTIKSKIIELENSYDLSAISNIIKLKNHDTAYRTRIGKYRLGFYHTDGVVDLARFVKREDIYDIFP
ncbi:plasmid stabilization protein [Nonlabens antarcticus]|uniref:plasmid stabilization protein n=1 Tax=Nonlabens antarcticus TaxID=392714 RepID=UPI001890B815|nr:plasmid stabilization protein [Nonlabens antarcticus]